MTKKSAVSTALRIARRTRKADGGELMPMPDDRPGWIRAMADTQVSPGTDLGNRAADLGSRYVQHAGQGMADLASTPGAVTAENPYKPGTEEHAYFENSRDEAIARFGPSMAMSMIGSGSPMAEAGALGAAGGRLRNQWTGQFRKEGVSPLPGNAYRSVNTQAKPVAANSAEVVSRMQTPTPTDPALLQQNLARMDNPMAQSVMPSHPDFKAGESINPHDVDYWKQYMDQQAGGWGNKNGGAISRAMHIAKADGGPVHEGYIPGDTGGRTDNKDISVGSGAYVIPADILSGLGEGNSQAGWAALSREYGLDQPRKAAGGPISGTPMGAPPMGTDAVPIVAASGEAVIPPDAIIAKHGDLDTGHKVLDAVVKHVRAKTVKKLKSLPGPRKN